MGSGKDLDGATRRLFSTPPEPRYFDQPTAAAYFGVSERTFEGLWRRRKMPGPHKIGRRLVWDRKLLDSWADAKSGIEPKPEELPFGASLLTPKEREAWQFPNRTRWKGYL